MANVNPCDLLPILEADENTRIICMYMETIPEPYRFERVMSKVTKPVIVVKSGRTAKGAAAASSHTGSLAGNDSVAVLSSIFTLIIYFCFCHSLAGRFNKGLGYALGLFFLNPIFLAILTFNKKCYYRGW